MYSFDFLFAVFVMGTGFATSWICVEISNVLGWRGSIDAASGRGVFRYGAELVLTALLGPRLLLVNGFRNWRYGLLSSPLYAVIALIAAGWSMCSGVLVLQAIFASGFFLA